MQRHPPSPGLQRRGRRESPGCAQDEVCAKGLEAGQVLGHWHGALDGISRCFDWNSQRGSRADVSLWMPVPGWCCAVPAAPTVCPSLRAPQDRWGPCHWVCVGGWGVTAVLTALVSSLLFQSPWELCTEWWNILVGDLGWGVLPYSFYLAPCFEALFPHLSECCWFGGSIKRNPRILWVLPHLTGRTLVSSLRGDVLSWCSGCWK